MSGRREVDNDVVRISDRECWRLGGGHTPIIVLTADIMRHTEADMLAAGFDGYVVKPIQGKVLEETIRTVIS